MTREKILEKIDLFGELAVYLFIFFVFINSKMTYKIGYVLEGLAIIKIFYDWDEVKLRLSKGKKIYLTFLLILALGMIFNYFSSVSDGVETFRKRNIPFMWGVIILLFIDNQEKLKKTAIVIFLGLLTLSTGVIKHLSFIKLDIIRQRGILTLASSYSMIYLLEILQKFREKNKLEILSVFLITILGLLGIEYSDSRMGFLVVVGVLGLYLLYALFKNFNIKKLIVCALIFFIGGGGFYQAMSPAFKHEIKTSFQTRNNFSNEARIIMWEGSWKAFCTHPIIGVGSDVPDTQPYILKAAEESNRSQYLKDAFIKEKRFGEAHSIYFNMLAQVGSLTFVYLFLFFYLIPKRIFDYKKTELSMALFAGITAFYIYGITWSIWGYYGLIQKFYQILVALFIIATELNGKE